jgi:hypothetical protein
MNLYYTLEPKKGRKNEALMVAKLCSRNFLDISFMLNFQFSLPNDTKITLVSGFLRSLLFHT